LIHDIIDNVSVKELKQVFGMYKYRRWPMSDKTVGWSTRENPYIFEVSLDLPLTEEMVDLKDEINRQYYGEDIVSQPRFYHRKKIYK
jgi:hypothetical protein